MTTAPLPTVCYIIATNFPLSVHVAFNANGWKVWAVEYPHDAYWEMDQVPEPKMISVDQLPDALREDNDFQKLIPEIEKIWIV